MVLLKRKHVLQNDISFPFNSYLLDDCGPGANQSNWDYARSCPATTILVRLLGGLDISSRRNGHHYCVRSLHGAGHVFSELCVCLCSGWFSLLSNASKAIPDSYDVGGHWQRRFDFGFDFGDASLDLRVRRPVRTIQGDCRWHNQPASGLVNSHGCRFYRQRIVYSA